MSSRHVLAPVTTLDLPGRVDDLLSARWPFLGGRLTSVTTANACTFASLHTPEGVQRILARFARQYPGQDPRGLASLWGQWYCVTVWPPVVAAALVLGIEPALEPRHTALRLDPDATPAGLVLPASTTAGEPGQALEVLAREQTAPLFGAVSAATGITARVLWSNAINVLGWFLDELGAIAEPGTLAPGRSLLQRRRWDDSSRNPLYMPAARPTSPRPARRVCCLRYRLNDFGYCADCPITCR